MMLAVVGGGFGALVSTPDLRERIGSFSGRVPIWAHARDAAAASFPRHGLWHVPRLRRAHLRFGAGACGEGERLGAQLLVERLGGGAAGADRLGVAVRGAGAACYSSGCGPRVIRALGQPCAQRSVPGW